MPWLDATGKLDASTVAAWRHAVDTRHREAARRVHDLFLALNDASDLVPGISVVVAAPEPSQLADLERCLRSIAAQTVAPDLIEVIVVASGQPGRLHQAVRPLRKVPIPVRVVGLEEGIQAHAYDIGTAAAGRAYVTFIDGRDAVTPSFLDDLLAHANPWVIAVAPVVESGVGAETSTEPDGSPISMGELGDRAEVAEAKLVATPLARAVPFDRGLIEGGTLVAWATAAVERRVTFRRCPAAVAYLRSPRPSPPRDPGLTRERAIRYLDLVAELDRLSTDADPSTRTLLRGRLEQATEMVGDYLRRHPAEHSEVVGALDSRPMRDLPYRRLNRGLGRGLVIAYAFPPYSDTSGIVMAKRLRTRGQVADVVYNTMDRIRQHDPTTRRISGPYTCDEAVIATPTYFSHWPSMEKFAQEGMRRIREWTAAKGPYEWLYSRAHFAASHVLAATYKLANPAVAWTAEFSDPLSRGRLDEEVGAPIADGPVLSELRARLGGMGLPVPESRNCFVWCEEVAYALADELIFTNENQLAYMLGYCSDTGLAEMARKKAVISPHPTLSREFYSMADSGYPLEAGLVHLAYFGAFYATRGLDDVLAALADCEPHTRARLRVHVFTNQPGPLRQRADELEITHLVQVGGYVSFLEFLDLTTRFDCLVVNDTATREYHSQNPYLPSKWSDYQGSGTPVWGLVEEGSPLSQQPLAYRSPVGDIGAAREVLSRIVRGAPSERPDPAH